MSVKEASKPKESKPTAKESKPTAKESKPKGTLAVVRVRGSVHLANSIEQTLKLLNLHKKNHCVLLGATPQAMGMIYKVNDYVTWGEVDEKTIEQLVKNRARVAGGSSLTDEYLKKNSSHSDIKSFVGKLTSGQANLRSVNGLKPVFRLKPPSKGFDRAGIKKPYSVGGALGYRGDKMGELIVRMI